MWRTALKNSYCCEILYVGMFLFKNEVMLIEEKHASYDHDATAAVLFVHVCMYKCMVTHIARVWINRVWLPILLVVSWTGRISISLSAFAPENLVSRDGFGGPVPRQPAPLHTQAESGAYLRDSSRVPPRRPLCVCIY